MKADGSFMKADGSFSKVGESFSKTLPSIDNHAKFASQTCY